MTEDQIDPPPKKKLCSQRQVLLGLMQSQISSESVVTDIVRYL